MYAKAVWVRVVKDIDMSVYSDEGLFKNFDDTWEKLDMFYVDTIG